MNLYGLSRLSIAACLTGLVLLLILSVDGGRRIVDKQEAIGNLLQLSARINEFSAASDSLILFGADPGLWDAYRSEGAAIRQELDRLGELHPDARKAARRLARLIEAVDAALTAAEADSEVPWIAGYREPLASPTRSRIVMHQVAGQGIGLDAALDNALHQRQQALAREATWIGATLAGAALIFGALCVVAFWLIHYRALRPARSLVGTLERLRAGEAGARAPVTGSDELSHLAETLNKTLDERDAADAQLAERQERLQAALDSLADTRDRLLRAQSVAHIGSWEIDAAKGRFEWSDQVFRIFGLVREDFDGSEEAFFERVHPEDLDRLRQRRAEWLENGGEFDAEHRIVRPDGEVRWVHEQARVIQSDDGRAAVTTGTVQDITERRQMDERLHQFQQLFEGIDDLCAIIDDRYRYVWVNQAYAGKFGLSPEAVKGQPLEDVVGKKFFGEVLRPRFDRALAGQPQRFETTREFRGLGTRDLLARCYPIDLRGKSAQLLAVVVTDITSVRQAEAELANQGRLLDMAGRAARFGAWSVDLDSMICEWSDVVAEILGMPHGYAPEVEESIRFYAPEFRDRIRQVFNACAESGEPYDEELQVMDAAGQRRWVRSVGEAIHDDAGTIIRVQGAFQDISDRKALEHESRRLSDHLAAMLEAITDGFVAFDEKWRYTYVNAEAGRMLGKSAGELIGTIVWEQFPELAGTPTERALNESMHERVPSTAEEFFAPLDAWFEAYTYPSEEGVAAIFRDVTESHTMIERLQAHEAALRASRDELDAALAIRQALINSLPAHIAMLDGSGTVLDVNEQWRHYGRQNLFHNGGSDFGVGMNYVRLCEAAEGDCSEEARTVADGLKDVLSGKQETFALEYPCHSPDEKRWFRVMFSRLTTSEAAAGAVAMHIDITERKLAEQELNRLAYEDSLTGLHSRHGFAERLGQRFEQYAWPADGIVAMLDVVGQHDINDAHGYEAGDRVLVELGRRLQNRSGRDGLVGRTGGDEFVIYLPGASGISADDRLCHIAAALDQPFHPDESGLDIEVAVRIGYTLLGEQRRSPHDLVREAELALFENRDGELGETPWLAFSEGLHKQTRERIQLTSELRRALEADQFELHFQPKVNLENGWMIAAEALIRWQHPERGLLPPGLFIPVAEQSQLIGPIGDWVLRAACRQLRDWQDAGLTTVRVAVNVSQIQFMVGDFPAKVRAALAEFDVEPSSLSLEITESVFERQSDRLLADLRELSNLGVRLALDDFGTGYSSLLYLQRYPFDEIKIDQGFVYRLFDDRYSRDIVRAIMNLAQALNAEAVAEGIESKEVAEALVEMGCAQGQGYYYSMPLASEDFRWLLDKRSPLPLSSNGPAG